jgi:hypothetical protein
MYARTYTQIHAYIYHGYNQVPMKLNSALKFSCQLAMSVLIIKPEFPARCFSSIGADARNEYYSIPVKPLPH